MAETNLTPRSARQGIILLFVVIAMVVVISLSTVVYLVVRRVQTNNQHRADAKQTQVVCAALQGIYDGQFSYTHFLAKELHATPAQLAAALVELRNEVGPRPVC